MCLDFQVTYNKEHPNLDSFKSCIQESLEEHQLEQNHDASSIIKSAYRLYADNKAPTNEVAKVQLALLKTYCLEIIQALKQTENRKHFDRAVQALFDSSNPEAMTFCASITRLLRQHRLSGTYTAKEIIAEAYARSIVKIEAGVFIEIPLAWLRRTCLNVIREFKRAQTKIDKPKIDGDASSQGGIAIEQILLSEDLESIRLAFGQLSREDQNILQARIFRRLSWQEIGEQLENKPIKPGTARQRGSRAIIRLRQHYMLIRQNVRLLQSDDS